MGGSDESEEGDGGEEGEERCLGAVWLWLGSLWLEIGPMSRRRRLSLALRGMDEQWKSLGDDVFYKLNWR